MGRIKIDAEKCKGCGLCVQFCPRQLIKIGDEYNTKGYQNAEYIEYRFTDEECKCTGCTICATICPDIAIEVWR